MATVESAGGIMWAKTRQAKKDAQQKKKEGALAPIWFQAILDNNVKILDPWYGSSGFRTNHARFRSLGFDNSGRLAETFLLNTKLRRGDRETPASVGHYFTDDAKVLLSLNGLEGNGALASIELPPSLPLSLQLSKCLAVRRSQRTFTADPMPLAAVATLCRAAAGTTGRGRADLRVSDPAHVEIPFRSAPSAGGLYGIDLHIVAQHVHGLEKGLYMYQPRGDRLLLVRTQQNDRVVDRVTAASAYPDQTMTNSRAAFIALLVARPWKVLRKYGDRGLRYLFIEAGEITQNLHLAAVALGYGSVESASYYDDEMNEAIGVDGGTATTIHMVLVGLAAKR
jgi:SagB-type dehydrogenase family enzyme